MALEAVVFQQDNIFNYNANNLLGGGGGGGGNWSSSSVGGCGGGEEVFSFNDFLENQSENFDHHYYENWTSSPPPPPPPPQPPSYNSMVPLHLNEWYPNSSCQSEADVSGGNWSSTPPAVNDEIGPLDDQAVRPKRRRGSRSRKNKEEIENQRMTHIAVERNRRKQMNEYLSVLRSLMPESYVQRGDQASIIGGAINFVKELEQRLQWIGSQKEHENGEYEPEASSPAPVPFSEFFTFPQYTTSCDNSVLPMIIMKNSDPMAENQSGAIADIEVTMVESHANLKIRSKRRPKQLLKLVSGLQNHRLSVLHLNVTTVHQFVLYSISVKVEDECKLTSVDEIATAVHQILARIQDEALSLN